MGGYRPRLHVKMTADMKQVNFFSRMTAVCCLGISRNWVHATFRWFWL